MCTSLKETPLGIQITCKPITSHIKPLSLEVAFLFLRITDPSQLQALFSTSIYIPIFLPQSLLPPKEIHFSQKKTKTKNQKYVKFKENTFKRLLWLKSNGFL